MTWPTTGTTLSDIGRVSWVSSRVSDRLWVWVICLRKSNVTSEMLDDTGGGGGISWSTFGRVSWVSFIGIVSWVSSSGFDDVCKGGG